MKYIVSANYRDRDSEFPWLVRQADESPSQALAFKAVDATGIEFKPSEAHERGFGCSMVAECDSAIGYGPLTASPEHLALSALPRQDKSPINLRFNGMWFVIAGTRDEVEACASLRLNPDRSMQAVIAAPPKPARKRRAEPAHA